MATTVSLQRFAEDELLRAPQLAQSILEGALAAILQAEQAMRPSDRSMAASIVLEVRRHHLALVESFSQSVREQVVGALAAGPDAAPEASSPRAAPLELRLVDDDTIVADVEIAHCVDTVKGVAEYELREIETFASAMAGDMQVARQHNPFKPIVFAKALWAAVQRLRDDPPGLRMQFMRHTAPILARELRKAYAAACARLEDAGVTPAVYSTVIIPPGAKVNRQNWTMTEDALRSIAEGMPSIAAATAAATAAAAQVAARLPAQSATAGVQVQSAAVPQPHGPASLKPEGFNLAPAMAQRRAAADGDSYLDLLSRVLDTMVADPKLIPKSRQAITRLRPALMRLAERDQTLLDSDDLAVWRFVDRIAWLPEIAPELPHPERVQAEQLVNSLVDHILGSKDQNGELYRWGLVRMLALERKLFQTRRDAAATQIVRLGNAEQKAFETGDIGGEGGEGVTLKLETVPAALMDAHASAADPAAGPSAWLDNLKEGDHALLCIQGRWVSAVLLWHGPVREMWLWADCRTEATWPVRRSALAKLHAARLATPHEPRSLARLAARAISHQIARSRRG